MTALLARKLGRALLRKLDSRLGGLFFDLAATLDAMASRPFELHLELTNICNASCVFCPYRFQARAGAIMSDEVFYKAVGDFVSIKGGSVGLTPIVGEALIDPAFLARVRYLRALPEIDRIFVTTNAILVDKFGARELLTSGLTTVNISVSSFDKTDYERVYGSSAYDRMRTNVVTLVEENARLGYPVNLAIGLRTGRPLAEVMKDPDFAPILAHRPQVDFTWSFTSAGGRIAGDRLPQNMRLREAPVKKEPCVSLYNGPMVLANGDVLACSCVAAMDAVPDLLVGNVCEASLAGIWRGERMKEIRDQFRHGAEILNKTCALCDMYRDLELYRCREGRTRAALNRKRLAGESVRRADRAHGIFAGG